MASCIHCWALQIFIEAARYLSNQKDVCQYSRIAQKIPTACDDSLWDGQ